MTHPLPLYPTKLEKGDKIGVIAPSSHYGVSALTPAVEYLTQAGFEVIFHPQTAEKHHQMAGTPTQKLGALHDYFADPTIKAIFCTCGGNGALHLLDQINYKLTTENPKIFIGFSDITVLLNAISVKTGLVTFHGPTLTCIPKTKPEWPEQMLAVLTGESSSLTLPTAAPDMKGALYGGNLSMMQSLIGTPYAPDMKNAVLMLEDINDHFSRYDRMIAHMRQAGWLKELSGVILGEFLKSQDNPERPFGFDIADIMKNHAPDLPILHDAPIGHGENLATLPIGAPIVLKDSTLSFKALQ